MKYNKKTQNEIKKETRKRQRNERERERETEREGFKREISAKKQQKYVNFIFSSDIFSPL